MSVNLEELEKLERKATKGPWHDASGNGSAVVSAPGENCAVYLNVRTVELDETVARWQADAALIVALRNEAVPMIQELRALRAEVEGLKVSVDALNRTTNEYADAARETESGKREMVLEEQLVAARAQLATARAEALEEAARACADEASEYDENSEAGAVAMDCEARVRALKTTKGTAK